MADWEYISQGTGDSPSKFNTWRMRVPGGWLYRVMVAAGTPPSATTTFVPDAEHKCDPVKVEHKCDPVKVERRPRSAEWLLKVLPKFMGYSEWRNVAPDFATNGTDYRVNRLIGFNRRLFNSGWFNWALVCDKPPYVVVGRGECNSRVGYTGIAWPDGWPEYDSGLVVWCFSHWPQAIDVDDIIKLLSGAGS